MEPKCYLCHSTAPLLGGRGFGRKMEWGDGMRGARFVVSYLGGVGQFGGKWGAGGVMPGKERRLG